MRGTLHAGASGWSYPSWRGGFYPADARPEDFLRLYAERLPAVELNVTGYRLPAEEQFERWAEQVPDGFRFAVKTPERALRDVAGWEARVRRLGDRLGALRLVVERPRDDGFLAFFLGSADPALPWALDLRDPSWGGVGVAPAVRVGAVDGPGRSRYVRFRDPPYDDAALAAAADLVRPVLDAGVDVLAFFRHEDEPTAPAYAERLIELAG